MPPADHSADRRSPQAARSGRSPAGCSGRQRGPAARSGRRIQSRDQAHRAQDDCRHSRPEAHTGPGGRPVGQAGPREGGRPAVRWAGLVSLPGRAAVVPGRSPARPDGPARAAAQDPAAWPEALAGRTRCLALAWATGPRSAGRVADQRDRRRAGDGRGPRPVAATAASGSSAHRGAGSAAAHSRVAALVASQQAAEASQCAAPAHPGAGTAPSQDRHSKAGASGPQTGATGHPGRAMARQGGPGSRPAAGPRHARPRPNQGQPQSARPGGPAGTPSASPRRKGRSDHQGAGDRPASTAPRILHRPRRLTAPFLQARCKLPSYRPRVTCARLHRNRGGLLLSPT